MGSGLSPLMERVGGLSPNEEITGEETSTRFLLRNQTMFGQEGSDCTSLLEESSLGNTGQEYRLWELCYTW